MDGFPTRHNLGATLERLDLQRSGGTLETRNGYETSKIASCWHGANIVKLQPKRPSKDNRTTFMVHFFTIIQLWKHSPSFILQAKRPKST